MASETVTTEKLRATLFATIEGVLAGEVSPQQATAVSKVTAQMIKTAELEMQYTAHLVEVDASDAGIAPGPMALAQLERDGE